jgi:hypothetical protein
MAHMMAAAWAASTHVPHSQRIARGGAAQGGAGGAGWGGEGQRGEGAEDQHLKASLVEADANPDFSACEVAG